MIKKLFLTLIFSLFIITPVLGAGIDVNTTLMLHLDGADGATSTIDSSFYNNTIGFNGTAQLDTAVKKWGTASLLLDGNSDYLDIDDNVALDIFGSSADDWTFDFWVKHTDHVGAETYFEQYEDASNRWTFFHAHGQGLEFRFYSEGGYIIDSPVGGEIADTNWHHIALIKVADEYGIYKDGTHVVYVQDDSTDTLAGSLFVGARGNISEYFYGSMDEIRIQHSNYFGAAPNATPDDTITVPTEAYNARRIILIQ